MAPSAGTGPAITEIFTGQASALANVVFAPPSDGAATYGPSSPFDATPAEVRAAVNAANLSVTGAGITVGVLSDSFNDLGGAAQDEADGALPPAADIDVLKDLGSGGTDEGRAMMEVVHDIAPGANLDFYTADVSEQDFANGILALAAAGCKVICDDVTYFDEPFFQTGVVANAIQTVEQEGVIFVTAAGNDAENGYQAAWNPISSTTFDSTVLRDTQNFGGGSPVETVTLGGSSNEDTVPFVFEWNQPYGSVTSDLEVLVFSGGRLLGTVTNTLSGEPDNPYIAFGLSSGATYQIAVENLSGPNPGLIGEMAEGDGFPVTINVANAGTVQGHHMSTDAITVGAVDAGNTPAFGGSLQSESYSSSGVGTQLWFNYNGSEVANAPLDLSPVAVSGVDDIDTTVTGGLSDFFGTSAATPSVAAVVALMLQENPNLTFAQVEQILEQTATSFGNSEVAGAGLVNAAEAVQLAGQTGPAAPPSPPVLTTGNPNVTFTADGPAVTLDNALTIADGESATLAGATVQITGGTFGGDDDVLSTDVAGTAISASYNDLSETLVLSGTDTVADYQAVLRLVAFTSTSQNPTNSGADTSRTVSWVVNDGQQTSTPVTTTLNVTGGKSSSNSSPPTAPVPLDFNGDGISDMLWRNSNGTLATWLMNGSAITSSASPTFQGNAVSPDSSWSVAGISDFDGATSSDADVLWRQSSSGAVAIWFMDGSTISSSAAPTFQGHAVSPDSSWSVAGIGDFNGNGDADILWRQSTTGALADWSMNGSTITAGFAITYQGSVVTPDSSWNVAGIGDFTGDGKSDIVWRQGSTGALAEWQMNGATIASSAGVTYQGSAVTPDSSWSIAAVGDFSGNGEADILWRQSTTGTLAMWLMNGSTIASSATVTYQGSAVKPDSSWNIVEIGDFNGGNDSEILWRQSTTGLLTEWQMNGAQIVSSQEVTSQGAPVTPNSTWQTQAKPTDFA